MNQDQPSSQPDAGEASNLANVPQGIDSRGIPVQAPKRGILEQVWSWVVVGAALPFILGTGVAFMTSTHPWAADGFFAAGTILFLAKFSTWEDARNQPPRKKWLILISVISVSLAIVAGTVYWNHKINPSVSSASLASPAVSDIRNGAEKIQPNASSSQLPESQSNKPSRKTDLPHNKNNKPRKGGASGSQTIMRDTPDITTGVKQASEPIQPVPAGPAPAAQPQPKPDLSCPSSGKLAHHWALDKTQDRWTAKLSIVDEAVGYPLQQKIAVMGYFDLPISDPELIKQANGLLMDLHLHGQIPAPTKLKTSYGGVKNEEIQEEIYHEINNTLKLSWSCLNLVNGTPVATCGVSKEVPIGELSTTDRDALEYLDRFAKIQVDAKCLEAMRELTGSGK